MTDNLTYKGEALLYSWSDSAAGRKVTFLLPDEGKPHPFKDYKSGPKYGQAFALGCTPIDYDNPEGPPEPRPGDPVKSVAGYAKPPMTEAQRCGMLCADKTFQGWIAANFPKEWEFFHVGKNSPKDTVACVVRNWLRISSRSELDNDVRQKSREGWQTMLAQFEADTGRMAERTR
jgi:hypothetical protein